MHNTSDSLPLQYPTKLKTKGHTLPVYKSGLKKTYKKDEYGNSKIKQRRWNADFRLRSLSGDAWRVWTLSVGCHPRRLSVHRYGTSLLQWGKEQKHRSTSRCANYKAIMSTYCSFISLSMITTGLTALWKKPIEQEKPAPSVSATSMPTVLQTWLSSARSSRLSIRWRHTSSTSKSNS